MIGPSAASVKITIKRLVTCFILCQDRVALFRRCGTMPTFASHWAGISGSIENSDASPLLAAQRELAEETNLLEILNKNSMILEEGLYVDVMSKGSFSERIIRVYPFCVRILPEEADVLELRGSEHDHFQFVQVSDLLTWKEPCVPGLTTAFHHATFGRYKRLSSAALQWSKDYVNGAAILARRAIEIAGKEGNEMDIAMLRPTMVPIVNAMRKLSRMKTMDYENPSEILLRSFDRDSTKSVDTCVNTILNDIQSLIQKSKADQSKLVIATFSRSSTLKKVIHELHTRLEESSIQLIVWCSQSTPGDEGELMAQDIAILETKCIPDDVLIQNIQEVDLVLIGSDCIMESNIVNKIGTKQLAECAVRNNIPIYCCSNHWKIWDDLYPPPMESAFEMIPTQFIKKIIY